MGMKHPTFLQNRKQERISADRQNEICMFSGDFSFFSSLKRTKRILPSYKLLPNEEKDDPIRLSKPIRQPIYQIPAFGKSLSSKLSKEICNSLKFSDKTLPIILFNQFS